MVATVKCKLSRRKLALLEIFARILKHENICIKHTKKYFFLFQYKFKLFCAKNSCALTYKYTKNIHKKHSYKFKAYISCHNISILVYRMDYKEKIIQKKFI